MARSETTKINNTEFTARCLTVGQVKQVLEAYLSPDTKRPLSVVEFLIEDGLPPEAFFLSLGIEEGALADLSPEDIVELMNMVAAANPTFAEADKRNLEKVKVQQQLLSSLKTSVQT